jgi:ABC-2 type transport system ATP-binding protein
MPETKRAAIDRRGKRRRGVPRIVPPSADGRGDPLIRARGLTRHYGAIVAVDHLDLDVWAGEIFGILGPNGAGKTTTILMLLGLSEPTSGTARVLGLDPARNPLEVKRQVGYLPDNAGFYGGLTGRQNLRFTARLNGIGREAAEETIDELLEQVGLGDAADRSVETYSRGMRQRLGIADALVKEPQILILDEPTVAIDPVGVAEMLALMRRLVADRGISLLLASHLLDQVQSVCDRVGIFAAGRMIGLGTVPTLARQFGDGTARIELGVEAAPDAEEPIARILSSTHGVVSFDPDPDQPDTWILRVSPAEEEGRIRATLATSILAAGHQLTTIRALKPSLDEIYRRAVELDAAARHSEPRRPRPPRSDTRQGAVV